MFIAKLSEFPKRTPFRCEFALKEKAFSVFLPLWNQFREESLWLQMKNMSFIEIHSMDFKKKT